MLRRIVPAILGAVLLFACGGDGTTTTSEPTDTTGAATSADLTEGGLSLHVEGQVAADVSVAAADTTEYDFGDDIEVVAAFELEPSGTTLDTPAAMTFDTGIEYDGSEAIPFLMVLLTDDGETWEALPVDITITDGAVSVSAEVPHFSRLVINRGDFGVYFRPFSVDTAVGSSWYAYFDIYDRQFAHITNLPARRGFAFDEVEHTLVMGRVRDLGLDTEAFTRAVTGGVVETTPGEWDDLGTYDYLPLDEQTFSLRSPLTYTEVFWGEKRFRCAATGTGTYGFETRVVVDQPNIVFGARFASGQLALVRPRDGVQFNYKIDGPARCRDLYGRTTGLLTVLFEKQVAIAESFADNGIVEDTMSDPIYSISSETPGVFIPAVDLWDAGALRIRAKQYQYDFVTNFSVFECGETADVEEMGGPVTTVCPTDVVDIEEGDLIIVSATYSGDLPGPGAQEYYTYSAVFESNGDPSDDWVFQGPYDWDFYIGTDRWYQLNWDPNAQAWSLFVSNALDPAGPSGVRALIAGDTIIWLIPASEFASDTPLWRVTSFVHDGTFQPAASGGDVNGADPTEPLQPVLVVEE